MPLLRRRPLLRAAAVGGGAYALGKHRERSQQAAEQQAYDEGMQDAGAASTPDSGSSGLTSDDTQRLRELGQLHQEGVLTDEEFAEQKAAILGRG